MDVTERDVRPLALPDPVKICHRTGSHWLWSFGAVKRALRLGDVPGGRGKRSLHSTLVAAPPSFLPVQSKGAASGRPFTTLGVLQHSHDADGRSTHGHAMLGEPATCKRPGMGSAD